MSRLHCSEDEASIGALYKRFARATMDSKETRGLLFEYFIDKIFVGDKTLTIASWFFDGGQAITLDDLPEAKQTGEVLNIEFDTSPSGGAEGALVELCAVGDHLLTVVVLQVVRGDRCLSAAI
ncbi:hypothetical protein [Bifidobacterium crudilactis]|uniref:hypothetical protein n=1 Tax=Bifidobacterium crudilactis TaxID=327277 RepID=UPI0023552AA1|nr:hypothetical protein [Bifidobacterium crudilactis]MDN5973227.1 hypothetical protein [Bifidobacterium crudilactis]MDN6001219.1 hypothetical protein [Bifidobacterium crudilactis]MDN6209168.1 hypothetical protein [Bifidobacterium crudilactis]MDN6467992.1 hypothetical protein [Bifidobacterium crudilactis]MDN6521909.1 hypothetical protein [Bifidobacterium crudilactis]